MINEQPFGINDTNLPERWPKLIDISEEKSTFCNPSEIMKTIETMQISLFKNKPVLGATRWFIIELIHLPENYLGVRMEDGHIENYALIKHDRNWDKLITIVETQN